MPKFKRRQFLQFSGAALLSLGYGQLDVWRITQRYRQVLAKGSGRKRALLIGISDYPGSSATDLKVQGLWYRLRGTVNDVMLQKELLMHRFGFQSDDIIVLTDQEATRANILEQFEQLIQWVQAPDDVVVFHYSGHGSNVIDPHQIFEDKLNGTIVPIDADLPLGYPQSGGEVDDITAGTIFLLREALGRKTNNVTFILDSCYSGGGIRGNLTFRSRPGHAELDLRGTSATPLVMSPAELDYQQRWLTDLQLSQEDWVQRRRRGQINGAAIFASRRDQQAADAAIAKDFHAGVFTYALTRHLWQLSQAQGMGKVMIATAAKTDQFLKILDASSRQTPGFEIHQESANQQQSIYFTPLIKSAAEAVITKVQGKSVELLLTGLEPTILEAFGKGAVFTVVDRHGNPQGTVAINDRDRIKATGIFKPENNFELEQGALLQEQLRSLPDDLTLRIGLESSLDNEREIATNALSSLPRIEVVPLLEQEVHYILGRVTPESHREREKALKQTVPKSKFKDAIAALPPVNSISLFSVGFDPIPGTARTTESGVEAAIASLSTKFRVLLAARLVKLMLNTNSSHLNVAAKLRVANTKDLLAQSFTVRGQNPPSQETVTDLNSEISRVTKIPIDKPVQVLVENQGLQDLHMAVLVFSPDGDIDVLFPQSDGPNAALVSKRETLAIPSTAQIQAGASLAFRRPLGVAEFLILASTTPIQKALVPLQALAQERRSPMRSESRVAQNTEGAIVSLLDDLSIGTRRGAQTNSMVRRLDPKQMAALSIPFEIVDES